MKQTIDQAILEAANRISRDDFVRAVLTGRRRGFEPRYSRVDLRPVEIKGEVKIQIVSHDGKKDFTTNQDVGSKDVEEILNSGFANIIVEGTSESFQIQITKKEEAITGVSKTKLERVLDHDHKKVRLLPESHPIFHVLGMSDGKDLIKPTSRDKYIQIDQLLRIMEPTLSKFEVGSRMKVVDLASGGGALTLAVHAYLSEVFQPSTVGIERNSDLVNKSSESAKRAGLSGIAFQVGEIKGAPNGEADLILALHACDTATDDAIDYAIRVGAKVALIVPCCHQSRGTQIMAIAKGFHFFGKDGIIDERLLDLATDAARGERLRATGYSVDIVEFVSDEHTARNLLIRAVRK